jgi:hypothetical protein
MLRGKASLIVAILALAACAPHPSYRDPARIAGLPQCELVEVDTTGWRQTSIPDIGLEFRHPPAYEKQSSGNRQVPGKRATDIWFRNGLRRNSISVAMREHYAAADPSLDDWRNLPELRHCTATFAPGDPPARVSFSAMLGEEILGVPRETTGSYGVQAEWRLQDGRVVWFVGVGPNMMSLREHLAIISTAHFVSPPPSPPH